MTWYWWSHWFWITFSHVLINVSLTGSIDTISPFKPNQHNNKREPLKFPIAVDTDSEDDIFGSDNEHIFNSDLIESDRTWISNSDKIIDNTLHNNNNNNDEDDDVVVNYNSKNNRTNSNSNNNSLNSNLDKTEKINNINSTIKSVSTITNIYISPNVLPSSTIETIVTTSVNSSSTESGSGDEPYTESNNLSVPENQTNDDIDIGFQENNTRPDYEPSRRKSKVLQEYRDDGKIENITDEQKNLLARSAEVIAQSHNEINSDSLSSEALSTQDEQSILNVGAISGICAIVIGFIFVFSITGVVLYRRRYTNKPQTLSEPDSSGYIDDSTIRDNSDEMYSLDNDSFLNSLEAMTIQNYWTENVKHTKL